MTPTIDPPVTGSVAHPGPAAAARLPITHRRIEGAIDGAYRLVGQDAADYHRDRMHVSCSMLKQMLVSPAHFAAYFLHTPEPTQAMLDGTLMHCLILEPHLVSHIAAIYPTKLNGRDRDVRDFRAANPNKMCVSMAQFDQMRGVADKVRSAPFRGRPFGAFLDESLIEVSQFYQDSSTGVACRSRVDALHPEFTFDVKTTRFGTPQAFARDALERDYDMQAYMYSLGRCLFDGASTPKPFVFVTVESSEPHAVYFMPSTTAFLENGASKYQYALASYAACSQAQAWPCNGGEIELDVDPFRTFDARAPRLWAL